MDYNTKSVMMSFCFVFIFLFWLSSCAHPSSVEVLAQRQSQARPRAAAYGADHFYADPRYREQENKIPPDHFFFKKCRIHQMSPYPTMHQWECTEALK